MSERHGKDGASGKQAEVLPGGRSRSVLLVVLSLGLCAGMGVFLAVKYGPGPGADPGGGGAPGEGRDSGSAPAAETAAVANEKLDRALRQEQLLVGKALAEEFPENQNAFYLLGLVYQEQGSTVEAISCWKRSLQLGRSSADVHGYLGQAALLKEDFETAVSYYKKALELQPLETEYREGLAKALMYEGKMEQAIPVLRGASQLTAEGHRMIAEAHQQLQDYENARKSYEAAIEQDPDLAEAEYGLARTCLLLGEMQESRKHMDRFRELKGKSEDVGRHWRKAFDPLLITRKSVAHTHTDVARVYLAEGNPGKAGQLLRKAAGLDPKNVVARMELALLHLQQNDIEEALRLYEEVRDVTPENPLVYYNLGNIRVRLQEYDAAERAFKKVTEIAPERADGYRALAGLYLRTDRNLPEARELASRAVEVDQSAINWATLSRACDKNGQPQEALEAIREAIRLEPSNPAYRRLLTEIQLRN